MRCCWFIPTLAMGHCFSFMSHSWNKRFYFSIEKSFMTNEHTDLTIDKYLRERLMPVEGSIPHISGIEMYGNSVAVESVGGDLFEYINFQQRYDIEVRIHQALNLSKEFLDP